MMKLLLEVDWVLAVVEHQLVHVGEWRQLDELLGEGLKSLIIKISDESRSKHQFKISCSHFVSSI